MWGKLHRELIVITIISVLILAVSFAFNFSASQKDILERQTYDYLLDAAHHTKVILHTEAPGRCPRAGNSLPVSKRILDLRRSGMWARKEMRNR